MKATASLKKKTAAMGFFFLLITIFTLLTPLLIGGEKSWKMLFSLKPRDILILASLMLLHFTVNAIRIKLLLKYMNIHLGLGEITRFLLAVDTAEQLTPASSGGIPAAILISRNLSISMPILTSAIVFVNILNGLAILAICFSCLLSVLILNDISAKVTQNLLLLVATVSTVFFTAIFSLKSINNKKKQIINLTYRLMKKKSYPFAKFWIGTDKKITHLKKIGTLRLALLSFLSLIYWACRLSILFTAIWIAGSALPWPNSALIQTAGAVAGLISGMPAGLLSADLTQAALLLQFMDGNHVAASLTLWRLTTFHFPVFIGLPILMASLYKRFYMNKKTAQRVL